MASSATKAVIDTIIAEAGNDPAGQAAVAAVIANRAREWGMTPDQVVKQKGQFVGYSNPGSGSVKAQGMQHVRDRAQAAWDGVNNGTIADPTSGALNFRTQGTSIHAPHGTVTIGGNVFAKGKGAVTPSPQTAAAELDSLFGGPSTSGLGYAAGRGIGSVPLPFPGPLTKPASISASGVPQAGQAAEQVAMNGSPLPVPRPGASLPNLAPDAMNGIGRLVPGRPTYAPTDLEANIGSPMTGQVSSMMTPGRVSASGSTGGPTPLLAGFSLSPSGQLRASGSAGRPQVPTSVSMRQPQSGLTSRSVNTVPINPRTGMPYSQMELLQNAVNAKAAQMADASPVSRGTMSAAGLPTTPNVMNGSVSMSPPRPPGVVPTTSGMAGTVQMAAARPSSIPVPQTDFRMLGNTQQWRPVNPPVIAPPAPPQGALGGMGGLMGGAGAGAGYVPTTPASMPPQPPTTLPNGMPIDSSVPLNSPTRMAYAQQSAQTYRPRVVQPPMVTIASGKTVPVGTTGTAENGRYTFTVQPDGTITKVTNPLTKQQRSDRFSNLDQFGMIK